MPSMERIAGLAFVLAMHAAVLWGLWQHRLIPGPREGMTLFVNFIAPPAPERKDEPKPPPPKPKPIAKVPPRIVATPPSVVPSDYVVPLPPRAPVITAPVAPPPPPPARMAEAVALRDELAATCPERTPPVYPLGSRRLGEEGVVVLRVELDELGKVSAARVATSSGFERLDEAALAAVRSWRCNPAQRDGKPVRAVALQPFKFILQGN